MPPPNPCDPVSTEAAETRCRIEAFRMVESAPAGMEEAVLRRLVNDRMAQLRTWYTETLGMPTPVRSRLGYTPPWSPARPGVFDQGVAWVDLHNPRHLHPLPEGHPAISSYLERSVRSRERIPGISPIPSELMNRFRVTYQETSDAYDGQPDVLREATEAHRSMRSALLAARRRRARSTGAPVRLVVLSELLAIEADASEAAFEFLMDWLEANCPPEASSGIPALNAGHRFPPAR